MYTKCKVTVFMLAGVVVIALVGCNFGSASPEATPEETILPTEAEATPLPSETEVIPEETALPTETEAAPAETALPTETAETTPEATAAPSEGGTPPMGAGTIQDLMGLANPASSYCLQQGYTLEIRTDTDGSQYGVCTFPDGSECEEWAYFRGECAPASGVAGWHTPTGEFCTTLQTDVMAVLGAGEADLDMNEPFTDYIGGTTGTGCLLTVTGTGADFTIDAYMQLQTMLAGQGWTEDMAYGAGGPTGIGGGFRRENMLLLMLVGWHPSDDANCPSDQPIGMCTLTPEQQLYEIALAVATQ